MKLKNILLVSAILTLSLSSCEDAYRVDAKDEIIDTNAITNITHLRAAMNGVYISVSATPFVEWSAYFADETRRPSSNRGSGVQVHTWSINTGTNEPETYYSNLYTLISRCNVVLDKIGGLNLTVQSEISEAKKYEAELRALRANAHFDLFRFFSKSYVNSSDPAIAIVTTPIVFEKKARNTVGEVVTFVNDELEQSYNDLIANGSNNSVVSKITPAAVQAMRARVALYTKSYDNAILYAQEVTNQIQLATTGQEYVNVFTDVLDTKEIIFEAKRITVSQGTIGTLFTDTNGDVLYNVSYGLFDDMVDDDVRNNVIFGNGSTFDNILVGKYEGSDPTQFGLADHKLFRVSEMYLILAEAYALKASPDYAASLSAINTLRAARRATPTALPDVSYSNPEQAITAILKERRIELAFEGHRYFDLRRLGIGVDRLAEDVELNSFAQSLPANDYRFVLPIPQAAIFANDNLVQNPGY